MLHPKCSKIASQQKQILHQSMWFSYGVYQPFKHLNWCRSFVHMVWNYTEINFWETQRASRKIAGHDSQSIVNSCPYSSVKRITKSQHTLSFSLSLSLNPLIIIQIQRIFIGASPLASIKGVTLDSPTMSKVCKRLLFNPVQISVHQVSCFLPRISKTVPSNSEVVVGMRTS